PSSYPLPDTVSLSNSQPALIEHYEVVIIAAHSTGRITDARQIEPSQLGRARGKQPLLDRGGNRQLVSQSLFDCNLSHKLCVLYRESHLQRRRHHQLPVIARERKITKPRSERNNT